MSNTTELPAFLAPVEKPAETRGRKITRKRKERVEKQKPGPKAGVLKVTSPCPYCGEPAHRKAVQNVKGFGPLRRMYCANGCGHYHYRDVETNVVVVGGRGPRVSPFHSDADTELAKLREELKKANQALKRAERAAKQAESAPAGDWLGDLAGTLGIDPATLKFTADDGKGRPRALVNCLSDADIEALPTSEDRETVRRLHSSLLAVQACIRAYKGKVGK